ncbi:F-box/kelch-repeat protein At3g23880-like [Neltuma alba]|uniref:F-box/kelch-repeat protein At3g23880-like n=1 Tax=Neltuma alba TaxID=207710 RepID=UPI0010A2E80F|nr:F-box/kelch-repeat protein At3g23880-like [Prosopis alba]
MDTRVHMRRRQSRYLQAEAMAGDLPPEIMVEILQRLPPKSLVRFRAVCKTWNSLITNPSFISDHLNRTAQPRNGNNFLLLQIDRPSSGQPSTHTNDYQEFYSFYSYNQLANSFSSDRFSFTPRFRLYGYSTVVGTCNGLVCFAQHSIIYFTTLIIWNPSLRKYVNLRRPIIPRSGHIHEHRQYRVLYGFGFDSMNMDYKVVRLVTLNNERDNPQVEVYSLASASWRSISVRVPLFFLPAHLRRTTQMFVNGALHWVVSRKYGDQVQNFILSFDVVQETFGELMLPRQLNESPLILSILEGGHLLAVLHTYSKKNMKFFSIWVMKEYGIVESWTEVLRRDLNRYGGIMTVLGLTGNGKVVLRLCSGAIVLLDPVDDLVKSLGDQEYFHAFAGPYAESLFFINKKTNVLSY